MQKIRQILLFVERGFSQRSIERETGINRRTIAGYIKTFTASGLSIQELLLFNDHDLHVYLNIDKKETVVKDARQLHLESHYEYFTTELRRVGVTRQLLWQEYISEYPDGFGYSRFCELLQDHLRKGNSTMHFDHEPGRLLEIDFAGDKLHYVDTSTGELIECPVFVAVLPYSGYSYVEALPNASLPQVVKALNNALAYFGGVPLSVKSDNMKQWVKRSNRYEPTFVDMIEQWANHNNIALLAARPAKPKDKPSVEGGVRIAYLRVYGPLRNETFTSLFSLNSAILDKLNSHHDKNFQRKTFSRKELFFDKEKPTLKRLPDNQYVAKNYTKGKVQQNYHVVIGEDWHFYSVPYKYIGKTVNVIYCTELVEIYSENNRIAFHKRSYKKHGYTTQIDHCPPHHQHVLNRSLWNPEEYLDKAEKYGPATKDYFQKVMDSKLIIDQTYQACQGLLRLASLYPDRIENACRRGLKGHRFNYMIIKNIIENNMDLLEKDDDQNPKYSIPHHSNIRGADEYK